MKTIYFAGGCFWGVEKFFKDARGVTATTVGYAQGTKDNITYEEALLGIYNAAETVEIKYDENQISLNKLMELLFRIIDPTSLNKQGNDRGVQYRTGIYFIDEDDEEVIRNFINERQKEFKQPIVVEVSKLTNYYVGEEYHQNYLEKHPNGYCHINLNLLKESERK